MATNTERGCFDPQDAEIPSERWSQSCSTTIEGIACSYVEAGISVIPLVLDGTKAPALPRGVPQVYSQRLPSRDELKRWFGCSTARYGVGMKCGAVSGGLEVIDFDMAETFWPWATLIDPVTFKKLSIVETPGGWHAIYRCREICGNRRLAKWEPADCISQLEHDHRECTGFRSIGKGPRIETRGEGGYVVAAGSPPTVHRSGVPYLQVGGPLLPNVQYVTPHERRAMWHAAASFDCDERTSVRVRKAKQALRREMFPDKYRAVCEEPWAWFDVNGRVDELLCKHNWHSDDGEHWTRPGKTFGVSAVLRENEDRVEVLTVFSSSAGVLSPRSGEAHRSFGPFALLTALEFGGDRGRAASYVRRELME